MNAQEARTLTEQNLKDSTTDLRAAVDKAIADAANGGKCALTLSKIPAALNKIIAAELELDGYKVTYYPASHEGGSYITVGW